MESNITKTARRLHRESGAVWAGLYRGDDSQNVETLMRSGHYARLFPDYEPGNVDHQEALATIGGFYG